MNFPNNFEENIEISEQSQFICSSLPQNKISCINSAPIDLLVSKSYFLLFSQFTITEMHI